MTQDDLRTVVCSIGEMAPEQVTESTRFSGPLASSLGRARLAALLRSRYNINDAGVYEAESFGQLCAALGVGGAPGAGNDVSVASAAQQPATAAPFPLVSAAMSGLAVGIDLEPIQSLPVALDLWEEPFYTETFTPKEIAYAQLRDDPRATLAATWSAKEAVRKSSAGFAGLDWRRIEVVRDADRKPEIRVDGQTVAGAISLTHTDELACAIFVTAPVAAVAVPDEVKPSTPAAAPEVASKRFSGVSWIALLVALAALIIAILRH